MNKYKKYTFGPEAMEYTLDCLKHGKTLSKLFLENQNLDNGQVITHLPYWVTEEAAKQFEAGGKVKIFPENIKHHIFSDGEKIRIEEFKSMDDSISPIIKSFLEINSNNICVFEDTLALKKDLSLSKQTTRIFTYQDDVFHFLLDQDAHISKIEKTISATASASPIYIGFMTSGIISENAQVRELSLAKLKEFAQRTEKLIIGAYDGEGYLIWDKNGTPN